MRKSQQVDPESAPFIGFIPSHFPRKGSLSYLNNVLIWCGSRHVEYIMTRLAGYCTFYFLIWTVRRLADRCPRTPEFSSPPGIQTRRVNMSLILWYERVWVCKKVLKRTNEAYNDYEMKTVYIYWFLFHTKNALLWYIGKKNRVMNTGQRKALEFILCE